MVVPVKFSFWFNYYINSQTSVELTADKMQNLLTKQELEGAYNTDLHELQKKLSLKPYFPNKHFLWDISIYQIKCLWGLGIYYTSIFFPLSHKVFVYHLNSCVLLI